MKRLFNTVAIVLLCGILSTPAIEARGRNNTGSAGAATTSRSTQSTSRSATGNSSSTTATSRRGSATPSSNTISRPSTTTTSTATATTRRGNTGSINSGTTSNRPGNMGNMSGTATSNRNNNNYNNNYNNNNNNNAYRSGNNNQTAQSSGYGRPGNNTPTPSGNCQWQYPGQARPNMPSYSNFGRPTPPASWRPNGSWRPFTSILGLALGTAYNLSVNALIRGGYTVSAYGNNMIMVTNAAMLNLLWPDGVLYYNTAGCLYGSQFMYSTPSWDMSRYNQAYAMLVNNYGSPISMQNTGNGVEVTWWGSNNQFITLSYAPEYAYNGTLRYFTKLSFGN